MRATLAMAVIVGLTAPASAHVTLKPKEAQADNYAEITFTVPHGCETSATTALRVRIPDGVVAVKPQMKPGWSVDIKKRTLEKPVAIGHGVTVTEAVEEVSWSGGKLPDNLYDTFGLQVRMPDAAGKTLYFPVVQECEKGTHRWIDIPGSRSGNELREPAPALKLTPKAP